MTSDSPSRHCIPDLTQHGDIDALLVATRITRRALLADARLYLCTDSRASHGDLREFLHTYYKSGTDIIQLRDKRVNTRDKIAAVEILAEIVAEHNKLSTVNDHTDIATLADVGILYMSQEDLTIEQVRQAVGPEVLTGRSNQNLDMFAASFADDDIDYAVIDPVYAAPTKLDRQPVGVDMACETVALVRRVRTQGSAGSHQDFAADIVCPHDRSASGPVKPWWVVSGINAETAGEVIGADAERIVVVRAPTEATSPEEAARALRAAVTGVGGVDGHDDK